MFEKWLIQHSDFRISIPYAIGGNTVYEPDIIVDPDDVLWAIWSERGRQGDRIRLQSYPQKAKSQALDCSTAEGVEFQPTITTLPDSSILVAWVGFRSGKWQLISRVCNNGQFGEEKVLYSNQEGIFHPRLLALKDDEIWLVCEAVHRKIPQLLVCSLIENSWSEAVLVPTLGEVPKYRPHLAVRPDGGVWVSYDAYLNGNYQVFLQRVDQISNPIKVTNNGYQNLHNSICTDAEGSIWIAWASNQNERSKERWWLTKWVYLRRFDGVDFSDPVSEPPGKDIYNEDPFQGWEFPAVEVDSSGRIWIFGQCSHTLYAQYYTGWEWSPLYTIDQKKWGSWKPRCHTTSYSDSIYLSSMGLEGGQLQKLEVKPAPQKLLVVKPREPSPTVRMSQRKRTSPVIISSSGEKLKVFFGDLHFHSAYGDGVGDIDELYYRYKDGYGYDFASLTEHDYLDGIELSQSEMQLMSNHASRMYIPGEFVTFSAYEWTAPAIVEHADESQKVGEGHKNIYFPEEHGTILSYGDEQFNNGGKLLRALHGKDVLVIPHHTGWSGIQWDDHDQDLQRLIEVCSIHGRFEYPGNLPIGYRRDHVHLGEFVIDGLNRGYKLGFVGGSDSHGMKFHHTELESRESSNIPIGTRIGWKMDAFRAGMTAIISPELSRKALYDALKSRRCYATSGVPILIDFRINGSLMGTEINIEDLPELSATVEGTESIRSIEVIRSGYVFAGVQTRPGEGLLSMSFSLKDKIITPGESHYYYLRVIQEDSNMAWSSPIWVTYAPTARLDN